MLFVLAAEIREGITLRLLGWVHLVALGWLTLIALSILIHVIPAFTDNPWRLESLARGSLALYAAGAAGLIAAFFSGAPALLPPFGIVIAVALTVYLTLAFATLFVPPPRERLERAIARALAITLIFLALAAALGLTLTFFIERGIAQSVILAPLHASFGLIGWLSLLAAGVSARTLRPIAGTELRLPALHIAQGLSAVLGLTVLALGFLSVSALLTFAGAAIVGISALLYVAQLALMLRGARNPHRPPQAFVAAAACWIVVSVALGFAGLLDVRLGPAFVFVLLTGWLGQMVVGHLHHIGIRLLATVARGEEDETRPIQLLDARLSWFTFVTLQCAVIAGAAGTAAHAPDLLRLSALLGLAGWCALSANVAVAWRTARRLPIDLTFALRG